MARMNARLEAARTAYREALEAARTNPTPDAWARLLAAGKELSAAEEPRSKPRRARRRDAGGISEEGPRDIPEGSLDLGSTLD